MGVDPGRALGAVPARGSADDTAAADMNNVLWASTMGAFLDQMMVPLIGSRTVDDVHDHFRRYVRGLGPYPALRVGKQPYGVLPVSAGRVATGDGITDQVAARVAGLRPFWAQATDSVPRLGESARPDVDTLELLRRTPWSGTFRFREAFGGSVTSSILGFDIAAVMQEGFARLSLSLAGISGRPRIAGITLDPHGRDVPVPLVTYEELSETDPLDPDYVDRALRSANTSGGFARLLSGPDQADTLLEALLRQSVLVEYAIGSTLLVIDHELRNRVLEQPPIHQRIVESEVLDLEVSRIDVGDTDGNDAGDDAGTSVFATAKDPVSLAQLSIQEVSGNSTLVNHLATRPNAELLEPGLDPSVRRLPGQPPAARRPSHGRARPARRLDPGHRLAPPRRVGDLGGHPPAGGAAHRARERQLRRRVRVRRGPAAQRRAGQPRLPARALGAARVHRRDPALGPHRARRVARRHPGRGPQLDARTPCAGPARGRTPRASPSARCSDTGSSAACATAG